MQPLIIMKANNYQEKRIRSNAFRQEIATNLNSDGKQITD